ncbi:MAG: two-component regulator propeller domain-containing protein, partial [Salinivirgaceae bacterium]
MKPFILLIILLFCSSILRSEDLRFYGYGTDDGISVGKVSMTFQDSRGFIWIATEDGLNLFDGYKFTVFRNRKDDSNSISNNKIFDIVESSDRVLWIATGYGLNAYDLNTGNFKAFTTQITNNALTDNEIRSLHVCRDSILLIGTHQGGLHRMNLRTQTISKIELPGNPAFIRSVRCTGQEVLVGTHGFSFYVYNCKTNDAQHISISESEENQYIDQVNAFLVRPDRHVWVATENGIFDWHRATGNITNITPRQLFDEADEVVRVRDFLEDRDGIVWVATNLGLLRYENGQWKRNV